MNIGKVQSFNLLSCSRKAPVKFSSAQVLGYPQTSKEISNLYYYPINFKSVKRTYSSNNTKLKEKTSDFQICKKPNVPCPACGKKIMTNCQFEKFAYDLANTPPDNYIDFLGNYTEYMRPVEESAYKEIKELSAKLAENGENVKDIRALVLMLREQKLPVLQKVQMRLVKKMIALAKTLPENEQTNLMNKINNFKREIVRKKSDSPFRRKIMIEEIKQVKISNPKKYRKLQNIALRFPASSDMTSAWIVKYSGKNKYNEDWTSYDIALRLLQVSTASTDHILAYDIENNHDDISNYLAMHAGCNSRKSNKTFMQWFNEDKDDRLKYLKDYFEVCDELIRDKKITKKKYRQYVAAATQTICDITQGQVDLRSSIEQEFMQ